MKFQKRKGQVFLIMTILVVSFIIGISSVLLEIKQSDFIEPAPGSDSTLRAWDITYDSLHQIMDVYLAQSSTGASPAIDSQIANLQAYLSNRGITNSITVSGLSFNTITSANVETHEASATFEIHLSTSSTTIDQSLQIDLSYTADASVANTVVIFKTTNGEIDYLPECTFSIAVTDNGNGSYTHASPGTPTTITTLSQVVLDVTTT